MLSRRQRLALFAPLLLVLVPFLLWPAAFGFLASLTDYAPTQSSVHPVGLENYAAVVQDSEFGATLRNSAIYTLATVSAQLIIGLFLAYLLREPFRGRGLLRVLLLIPWLISPVANGVMWHFMFNGEKGVIGFFFSWLGSPGFPSPLGIPDLALPASILTDIWRKAPLVTFLLLPGMLGIPKEQWEHATLEGASPPAQIRHIALPWLRPLLLTIGLLLVGDSLGTFDNILVMTGGGPGSRTALPALYSYKQAFALHNWPVGTTSAWMIVFAVVLVGIVYLRLARKGLVGQEQPEAEPGQDHLPRVEQAVVAVDPPAVALELTRRSPIGWRWQRRLTSFGRMLVLSAFVVIFLLPILWTVLASLGIEPSNSISPPAWTVAPSFENYQEVGTTEPGFVQELAVSLILSGTTTLLTILCALLAAYGLAQSRFKGRNVLVQSLLILASLPVMAYAIPLSATARSLRLYDTFLGVTLAESAVFAPLAVYILYGYVAQVPLELAEAARLDGADVWQTLRSVVLPIIAASVAATAVIVFVLTWNQFLVPFVLSTNQVRSIPMAMVDVFKWDRELEWSRVAAALTTSLLPLLILILAAQRLLERLSLIPSQQAT